MRNFVGLLLIVFLFTNSSIAQKQTLFVEKNYEEVIQQSKALNKPIVIMFYASWCVHCNKMKNEVFIDQNVINFYNDSYICMAIDSESQEGINIISKFKPKFKVKSFPTFAFIDSNENLLYCMSGEYKNDTFITEGKNVLIPENQFLNIKNTFNADVSNAENCIKFITVLRKAGFDATLVTQKYLATKSEADLFTELNWRILANGINSIDAKEINLILVKKEEFAKVSSPTRVEKKLIFIASDNLKPLADGLDTLNYYKKRPIAESFHIRKVDSLLFRFDLSIAEKTKNWKKYKQIVQSNAEKFAWKDATLLVDIATNYLNNYNDSNTIENAITYTLQSLSLGESLDKYKLISNLYIKNKDYKNALIYSEKAKAIALQSGWKTDEIEKLISEIKKH
jgi:thioredoxin-related protein